MVSPGKNKVEMVVDAILSYIVDRKMRIGSKLPPEEELARLFNVSRLCLRDALRGLKFLGMVETGTRRGTTLREIDFALLSRVMGFQIAASDFSYQELMQARLTIELGAIDILIGKVTDAELDDLEHMTEKALMTEQEELFREQDFLFHKKLLLLSGNTLLISFAKLMELFFTHPLQHELSCVNRVWVCNDHWTIIKALRERNAEMARGALRNHLNPKKSLSNHKTEDRLAKIAQSVLASQQREKKK